MKKFILLLLSLHFVFVNKTGFCKNINSSTKLDSRSKSHWSSPVTINAEKATYLQKENKVLFEKEVVAKSKDLTIESDKLIVILSKHTKNINDKNKKSIIKLMIATGHVHIIFQDKEGYCSTAEYDLKNQRITLINNVTLIQNKNKIQGAKLIIDLNKNTSEIFSNSSNKVEITFYPEKQKSDNTKPSQNLKFYEDKKEN
ncbi:hypothetical protein JCM13304A_19180 [Desulfothermus okinawensis JCM 13304]